MAVRQCPECELRFADDNELRDHLNTDHPGSIGERSDYPTQS